MLRKSYFIVSGFVFFILLLDRMAEDFESNRTEKERKTKAILDFSVSQLI